MKIKNFCKKSNYGKLSNFISPSPSEKIIQFGGNKLSSVVPKWSTKIDPYRKLIRGNQKEKFRNRRKKLKIYSSRNQIFPIDEISWIQIVPDPLYQFLSFEIVILRVENCLKFVITTRINALSKMISRPLNSSFFTHLIP